MRHYSHQFYWSLIKIYDCNSVICANSNEVVLSNHLYYTIAKKTKFSIRFMAALTDVVTRFNKVLTLLLLVE